MRGGRKKKWQRSKKFQELRRIEDVRINMFKYFCHCNKEVEEILLEDISKDLQILHELESFNRSLDCMQEKLSEKNQSKALAVVFWLIWRQ